MAKNYYTTSPGVVQVITLHDTITADAASNNVECAGAKAIGIHFNEGGTVNNRQADLTVDVSLDKGTTFVDYNMLIDNVTNTNGQQLTRIATKNRAATGTDILWFTPETLGAITHFHVDIDVTDGASPTGNFTVKAVVVY